MAKLEVGRFYKEIGLDGSTLIHYITKQEDGRFYGVYYDLTHQWLDDDVRSLRYRAEIKWDNFELIETLTPKEALILLGNGFELLEIPTDKIIKIKKGQFVFRYADERSNWKEIWLNDFGELFTIHALPEEAGE